MRQQLSVHYLREAPVIVSEIAFLLDSSKSNTFHRAFKRWTEIFPSEVRQQSLLNP